MTDKPVGKPLTEVFAAEEKKAKKPAKKKAKKERFTVRQKKYKAYRLKGLSQYKSAKYAGYSESYCKRACDIESSVELSMAEALEKAGLTDDVIAQRIEEGTRAMTLKTTKDDAYEVIDHGNRLKALELAGKFAGRLNQKVQIEGQLQHSGNIGFFEELVKRAGVTGGDNKQDGQVVRQEEKTKEG